MQVDAGLAQPTALETLGTLGVRTHCPFTVAAVESRFINAAVES
jgi:hypothetical protein